jgi:HD-GYP domain-containing protein (c-di-GMP phosphodiesterase class II)
MGGHDAGLGMHFTRVRCSDPEVAVFGISGSLGPSARPFLVRLTQECLRRGLPRLVLDLSGIESMGGGTARLLNEFAAQRAARGLLTAFCVTSPTVRGYLSTDPTSQPPPIADTLDQAVATLGSRRAPPSERLANASIPAPEKLGGPNGAWAPESASMEVERVLAAIGLEEPTGTPAGGNVAVPFALASAPVAIAVRIETELRRRRLAASTRLFVLQADGDYHPVTALGVDPGRGLPYHGVLARRLRAHVGPCFLFDLCIEPLTEAEARIVAELNSEVVARLTSPEHGEVLAFLAKERPGDEYTLDELAEVDAVLDEILGGHGKPASGHGKPAHTEVTAADTKPIAVSFPPESPLPAAGDSGAESAAREAIIPPAEIIHTVRDHSRGEILDRDEINPPPGSIDLEEGNARGETIPPEEIVLPTANRLLAAIAPPAEIELPAAAEPRPRVVSAPVAPAPVAPPLRETENERELRRKVTHLRDILNLSQGFDATFGHARLLDVLVLSIVSISRAESVLYFGERGGEFHLTHHRGLAAQTLPGMRLHADSTLVRSALASECGVNIERSPQISEEEKLWARQHDFEWVLPFRSKDQPLGIVLLGHVEQPDLEMLAHLLRHAALAYDRAFLYEMLQDRTLGVVRGLITLIEGRNPLDAGSTEQVVHYTQALAREIHYPHDLGRDLVYGAVLRDVGMLRIDQSILGSSGQLSADEWEDVRKHTIEGAAIMKQMRFADVALEVVLHHHEAYNGEGYPMGLRGRAIPLGARIVAVAESYVKMTMDRPYRKALGRAEALESLAENWGLRYDPLIVDALVRIVNRELSMGLQGEMEFTRDLFGV